MFEIVNNNITMTKGDSAQFDIVLENGDGTQFVPQKGDEIVFSVRRKNESFCPVVIEKRGEKIVFEAKDTQNIASGGYDYDIVIQKSTGERQTVIVGKFILRKAVHKFG